MTEFPVFVNFFHDEFSTGSDYYFRPSKTVIDTFEGVVVQRSIWYNDITTIYLVPLCSCTFIFNGLLWFSRLYLISLKYTLSTIKMYVVSHSLPLREEK